MLPASMSKRIFQATLSDPDVPDADAETVTQDNEIPAKSGNSSSYFEGKQSPLESSTT